MQTIEHSIEVEVPLRTAYDQWTQFEQFPEFMEGVESVEQLDQTHVRWTAQLGGKRHQWEAEIYDQVPDQRIAWRSISGKSNSGVVSFTPLSDTRTRVQVRLAYEPQTAAERIADAIGLVAARVKGDLQRFKEFIEARGSATGAWRGEIHGGTLAQASPPSAG